MASITLESTTSRDKEVAKLLRLCRDRLLSLSCERCGTAYTRSGAWLQAHPTIMCGRCFQDNSLRLNAVIQAVQTAKEAPVTAPQEIAGALPPLQQIRRH